MTDGSAGMEVQCIGLAEALGLEYVVKRIQTKKPWRWFPPALWISPLSQLKPESDPINAPWPDILITCGRHSIPINMAIKKASGQKTFTIHIQTPNTNSANFDLVIVPEHDKLRGPNVLVAEGALGRITPELLKAEGDRLRSSIETLPRPIVTVLVGGSNKCYDLTPAVMSNLAKDLASLHDQTGCSFLVTTSRRTGHENETILAEALAKLPHQIWKGQGENPYFGFLDLASAIVVTADSINMVCEASSMGKPVYIFELSGGNQKFKHFHQRMQDMGYTRPFTGKLEQWSSTPLLETKRIASEVLKILSKRT
ncbi:mitochondrial fission ELM1 family protein [Sneathiella marina]|uniref:Mitochondrial fission ELM1 family protein n=1 Tax=Sneathiella marina TaxID=2950108 RepID=A0ABY4W634_9PROT|nr:mitochondrial fission ELM1 family protein [Sneathiella marina]USG62394.1 mitochondrial fission ELM1 family protein [Sneathiella marina]